MQSTRRGYAQIEEFMEFKFNKRGGRKIMMNTPIYDERIIVGVIYNNVFNWYITNKLLWIMNIEKLSLRDYKECFEDKEFNENRKDINILSEKNIKLFLDRIDNYKICIDNLRLKILEEIEQHEDYVLEEYYPVLLLHFDKKIIYSQYPEPFGFENYVPDNWQGIYASFIELIEPENQYWIYKDRNLLK